MTKRHSVINVLKEDSYIAHYLVNIYHKTPSLKFAFELWCWGRLLRDSKEIKQLIGKDPDAGKD